MKYLKLNAGKTYAVNHAPQPGDYTEVDDPSEADMLLLESTRPLEANEGGYVAVSYAVNDTVGSACNDKRDVFNTVLDYDIEGNHSTLTLATNAATFAGTDVLLTKVWNDGNDAGKLRPTPDAFAAALTLTSDKGIDLSAFAPQAKDKGDGTYEVSYRGLPKYKGNAGNIVAYTLTEGDIAHYTTDSASIQGSGTTVEGTITNTYAPRPTTHDPAVEKKIEGPKPSNPDTFSFVLKRTDASFPMPAGSDGDTKTITVEGAGSPEFGDIAFTLPGTYTYTITETKGGAACTYDGSSYALTYEVADDGQGKLRAKRSMTKTVDGTTTVVDLGAQGDAIGAVFTNVYPTPDISTPTPNSPTSPDRSKATKVRKTVGTQALPQTGDGTSSPVGLLALSALVLASGSVVRWHKGQ